MLAALVIIVLLTLNIGGLFAFYSKISLYYFLALIPGFNAIRAVSRVIVVLMFPIAFIAGSGLSMLLCETKVKALAVGVGFGLVLLAAYEIRAVDKAFFSIADAEHRVDVIAQRAKAAEAKGIDRPVLALVAPLEPDDPFYVIQLDATLAAQRLGWPTVNGYSGYGVPGASEEPNCGTAAKQYLAFEAWQKAHGNPAQESVADLLRRNVFVSAANCANAR
jgi:hypothetical protein